MGKVDDVLGDEMKALENVESMRAANIGDPVVIRVDGASFSKFTQKLVKPFDERLAEAMSAAAKVVVEDFHCRVGYTQSDEMSFILWHPEQELPFGGRMQKLASRFAAKATAAFLLKAVELFPEAVARQVPEFDGRAWVVPTPDYAAKAILWRELDARKNAVSQAARSLFSANELQGKSSFQMKEMMAEKGVRFLDYPEQFRRGAFLRRVVTDRMLTPEELARIPEGRRPTGPVKRSAVVEVKLPNLVHVENLTDVLIHGETPLVADRRFAGAVTP